MLEMEGSYWCKRLPTSRFRCGSKHFLSLARTERWRSGVEEKPTNKEELLLVTFCAIRLLGHKSVRRLWQAYLIRIAPVSVIESSLSTFMVNDLEFECVPFRWTKTWALGLVHLAHGEPLLESQNKSNIWSYIVEDLPVLLTSLLPRSPFFVLTPTMHTCRILARTFVIEFVLPTSSVVLLVESGPSLLSTRSVRWYEIIEFVHCAARRVLDKPDDGSE